VDQPVRLDGWVPALDLPVQRRAEVQRLEGRPHPVWVPLVAHVGVVVTQRRRQRRVDTVESAAGVRDSRPERRRVGVVARLPRECVQCECVRDEPVVVEPAGVLQRLDRLAWRLDPVAPSDGLDDRPTVGVGHVDEHTVYVEYDCVGLHRPHPDGRRIWGLRWDPTPPTDRSKRRLFGSEGVTDGG
jgi:hypothetical protein